MGFFYASKNRDTLNGKPFAPESITGRIMVNPHYSNITVPSGVKVIVDSGAFQLKFMKDRPDPSVSFGMQMAMERKIALRSGYPFRFEAVVIFDMLAGVDEAIVDGVRVKKRGTEETARYAIEETLKSAVYYDKHRCAFDGKIVFVAQGVTPDQYVGECVLPLMDIMRSDDWFAFGGFCIIGKNRSLKPVFVETFRKALPVLKIKGVKRLHLLGVTVSDMVEFAFKEARKEGFEISTDSSSIEVNSVLGKVWDEETKKFVKVYGKEDKKVNYHPRDLAYVNTTKYDKWVNTL